MVLYWADAAGPVGRRSCAPRTYRANLRPIGRALGTLPRPSAITGDSDIEEPRIALQYFCEVVRNTPVLP